MASVKKCRHCQSEIEIEVEVAGGGPLVFVGPGLIKATVCPHCGKFQGTSAALGCLYVIAALIATVMLATIIWFLTTPSALPPF